MPGVDWRTSNWSGYSGNCVQVGEARDYGVLVAAYVRDSKDREGPVLEFGPDAWAEFLAGIKQGELDSPAK